MPYIQYVYNYIFLLVTYVCSYSYSLVYYFEIYQCNFNIFHFLDFSSLFLVVHTHINCKIRCIYCTQNMPKFLKIIINNRNNNYIFIIIYLLILYIYIYIRKELQEEEKEKLQQKEEDLLLCLIPCIFSGSQSVDLNVALYFLIINELLYQRIKIFPTSFSAFIFIFIASVIFVQYGRTRTNKQITRDTFTVE